MPLVLLLHGRTGDEHSLWQFSKLFVKIPSLIVSLRAPINDPDGGYTLWEIGDRLHYAPGTPFVTQAMIDSGIAVIDKFIAGLLSEFSLDTKKIFGVGFSQGGMAVSYLSLIKPELFRGVALLSSALATVLNPGLEIPLFKDDERKPSCFIGHGNADPIIYVHHAKQTAEFLKSRGSEVELVIDETKHKIGPKSAIALQGWYEKMNRY